MSAVSILVPTYNRAVYLKVCLDSLLATTVPCEIIVADNASTDDTAAVMATYTDPRIRYFRHETNLGPFANYNFLLQAAKHEYFCLFGDDDVALPRCFEKKLAILDHNPGVAGVYSRAQVMDADGTLSNGSPVIGMPGWSVITGRNDFAHLLVNCCISWQTLVFRRELYDLNGAIVLEGDDLLARDWHYLQRISRGRFFSFLNEPTVGIRIHAASTTALETGASGRTIKDMLTLWRKWLLEADDPPIITMATWHAFASSIVAEVQACFGPDRVRAQGVLGDLAVITAAYDRRMNQSFYSRLAAWIPGIEDLDADGLPVFHPGLAAMALSAGKAMRFFHHATWQSTNWQNVVRSFLGAFTADDDVELVLWHDDEQGVSLEEAGAQVAAVVTEMGLEPGTVGDICLRADVLDLQGMAALYAAMHVIVPGDDPRQLDRGVKMGRLVMTQMAPANWRELAGRFKATLPA
jgi:hypothetical protein